LNPDGSWAARPFPVGTNPAGIAFDGTNMWVTNNGSNDVTELNPDGLQAGCCSFPAGPTPRAIALHGTHMWVANSDEFDMTELNIDGSKIATFPVGNFPEGIAFDGTDIWVTNDGVTRLRAG